MRSWDNLPLEVIKNILDYLTSRKDVGHCELVCEGWSKPAQEIFFREIVLDKDRATILIIATAKYSSKVGELVHTINCQGFFFDDYSIDILFPKIIGLCSNVKVLITDFQNTDRYDLHIMEARYEGKIRLLEEIPAPTSSYGSKYKSYNFAVRSLRSSLKRLRLFDSTGFSDKSFENNKLAEGLQQFPRLKDLEIHIKNNESIFKIGSLIQNCPTVETITFVTFKGDTDDQNEYDQDRPLSTFRYRNNGADCLKINHAPISKNSLLQQSYMTKHYYNISVKSSPSWRI